MQLWQLIASSAIFDTTCWLSHNGSILYPPASSVTAGPILPYQTGTHINYTERTCQAFLIVERFFKWWVIFNFRRIRMRG